MLAPCSRQSDELGAPFVQVIKIVVSPDAPAQIVALVDGHCKPVEAVSLMVPSGGNCPCGRARTVEMSIAKIDMAVRALYEDIFAPFCSMIGNW